MLQLWQNFVNNGQSFAADFFVWRFLKYANYSIKTTRKIFLLHIPFDEKFWKKWRELKVCQNVHCFSSKTRKWVVKWKRQKIMKIKSKYYNEKIIKMMIFSATSSMKYLTFYRLLCGFQLFSHSQLKSFVLPFFLVLQPVFL